MNRHHQKRRIAARMARRRARIIRQDAGARYLRSGPYVAAIMQAHRQGLNVRACKATTPAEKISKAKAMIDSTVAMCELAVKAAKVRNTPTEILERI